MQKRSHPLLSPYAYFTGMHQIIHPTLLLYGLQVLKYFFPYETDGSELNENHSPRL
jgi:hypothetical protein